MSNKYYKLKVRIEEEMAPRCILISGTPGIGKTTLIIRVVEILRTRKPNLKIQGFYTREIRHGNQRVGFEVVTMAGLRAPLASIHNPPKQEIKRVGFEVVTMAGLRTPLASIKSCLSSNVDILHVRLISGLQAARWPTVGRYHVDVASFERVVLPELQIHEDTDLFVIDEVGKMELYSSSFLPAVLRVLNSNIPMVATIPVVKHGRDIPGVERLRNHPGATLYMLNPSNRDEYRERVYSQVVDLLSKH